MPPGLRFSPTAWAKLLYLRDVGPTEVGGFGIAPADDLLYIDDVRLVRQACTAISVAFDDQSVADFFDQQVDQGRRFESFARIWVHSHPGNSPEPTTTDNETFDRVFGRNDWAVMFILAHGGRSYARLRFSVGPGGEMEIPITVDYSRPFAASNEAAWREEYTANVRPEELPSTRDLVPLLSIGATNDLFEPFGANGDELNWWDDPFDEPLSPKERPHDNCI